MSKPYRIRPAELGDRSIVLGLLDERAAWLRTRGLDQWNTGQDFPTKVTRHIGRGEAWLFLDGRDPIGTITVSPTGDRDFWTPEELRTPAIYVSKMATRLDRRGEALGRLLIGWAQNHAVRAGVTLLRWDAWRTNPRLHDYYRALGARYLRSVEAPGRWSGALFELPAQPAPDLTGDVVTE